MSPSQTVAQPGKRTDGEGLGKDVPPFQCASCTPMAGDDAAHRFAQQPPHQQAPRDQHGKKTTGSPELLAMSRGFEDGQGDEQWQQAGHRQITLPPGWRMRGLRT